ncbi:MAG: lipid-binding SYLF domain-containing protein [Candidatus Anammoximicrobium sp.]|nr:lipid-binding SYLF domain-containing protein [Candidatus Anammoximicrobium sp.]
MSKQGRPFTSLFLLLAGLVPAASLGAQSQPEATVEETVRVLNEIMAIPAKQIPQAMLANAQGLAIVPNIVKGGFVVGVRYGRGVVVVRDAAGVWQPPTFVTLTGGSLGWQAGIQASDLILVFRTQKSVQGLMNGKFTIGADAAAAAGPVGRQAAAATDAQLSAEILSYSRSRGLFAGVALDGTAIQVDIGANQMFYRQAGLPPAGSGLPASAPLPPSAVRLMNAIVQYTGGALPEQIAPGPVPAAAGAVAAGPPAAAPSGPPDLSAVQTELAGQSQQLLGMLDDNWKRFLALPPEAVTGKGQVSPAALTDVISRYEAIVRDPQYQALTQRPEFRATLDCLRRYRELIAVVPQPALLPPPPPTVPQTGAAPGPLPRY